MSDASVFTKTAEWVPLPKTERGFATQLGTNQKKRLLAYASGASVVVRSVDDPAAGHMFFGHNGVKVNVAKISPNGEWVASGDDSGKVLVWGINNGNVKNEVLCGRKVTDLAWSGDGKRLVAAGDGAESKVKAFPWDSSNALGDMSFHTKAVVTCDFKPSRPFRVVTGGEDSAVAFYHGPPFKFNSSFREHTRFVNCVRYSPDGNFFVSVGADRLIAVFDGKEGTKVGEVESKEDNHTGSIYSVAWSPDSKRFLTASSDKTAKLWDAETRTLVSTFTFGSELTDQQVSAAFCGDTMVTVSLSGAINVLDPENPAVPARVFQGHSANLAGVSADAASGVVVSGDSDGRLASWNRETGEASWFAGASGKGVVALAVVPGGERVAVATADDKLRFCETKTQEWSAQAIDLGGRATAVAACPDDADLVAVAVAQGQVLAVRPSGVVARASFDYRPLSVAVRNGGAEIAVGGDDKKTHVYAVAGDALNETGSYPSLGKVASVQYSQDGTVLYSGCGSRTLLARDAANGYAGLNDGHKWTFHNAVVRSVTASPSGDLVVSGSQDQALTAFPKAKECGMTHKRHMDAHNAGVSYVSFLDEASLVSAGVDNAIRFWTVQV